MGSSKELETKPLEESDEGMLQSWFIASNRSFPPKWMRGNSGVKVVNSRGDVVAVGWLIPTANKFALAEFLITNPAMSVFRQAIGFRFLVRSLIGLSKELGFKAIFGFVPVENKSVVKWYQRIGGNPQKQVMPFYMEVN